MQVEYTKIKTYDLKKIIEKETGLTINGFARQIGQDVSYFYKADKNLIILSADKWERLKNQIEAVKKLNKLNK